MYRGSNSKINKDSSAWFLKAGQDTICDRKYDTYAIVRSVSRFSVHPVCGTGLNIPRSLSVMRPVTISWRWTATAETLAMLWQRQSTRSWTPTGGCSALRTGTTMFGPRATVRHLAAAGGSENVRWAVWPAITASGQLGHRFSTCKQVACSWDVTRAQPLAVEQRHSSQQSSVEL